MRVIAISAPTSSSSSIPSASRRARRVSAAPAIVAESLGYRQLT